MIPSLRTIVFPQVALRDRADKELAKPEGLSETSDMPKSLEKETMYGTETG